jgi:hypothetical protein
MVLERLRHCGIVMDGEVTQSERECFYALRLAAIGTAWIHPPPLEDSACPPRLGEKKGLKKKGIGGTN